MRTVVAAFVKIQLQETSTQQKQHYEVSDNLEENYYPYLSN